MGAATRRPSWRPWSGPTSTGTRRARQRPGRARHASDLSEPWAAALGPDYGRIHSTRLHTPGNLTLTVQRRAAQQAVRGKAAGVQASNIVMTRELADFGDWSEPQIERAAGRWPRRRSLAGPARPSALATGVAPRPATRSGSATGTASASTSRLGSLLAPQAPALPQPGLWSARAGVVLYAYLSSRTSGCGERLLPRRGCSGCTMTSASIARRSPRWVEARLDPRAGHEVGRDHDAQPRDPTAEALWPTYYDWMRRMLETFQRVLGPRIPKIESAGEEDTRRGGGAPGELSATGTLALEYWSALRTRLIEGHSPLKPHKPGPQHWTSFAVGRAGFHLSASFVRTRREIGIWLVLGGPLAKAHFHLLAKDSAAIESELG
ncbi:MAG: DUF4268 domain-containing protein, partial [Singulisphaera sp.]